MPFLVWTLGLSGLAWLFGDVTEDVAETAKAGADAAKWVAPAVAVVALVYLITQWRRAA